jgi:hypothetical protein
MAGKTISVEVPDELWAGLREVAEAFGISSAEEAAVIAIAEWTRGAKRNSTIATPRSGTSSTRPSTSSPPARTKRSSSKFHAEPARPRPTTD